MNTDLRITYTPKNHRGFLCFACSNDGFFYALNRAINYILKIGSYNNCLSVFKLSDKIKVVMINLSVTQFPAMTQHPSTGDMKLRNKY
jgi:hypothetical protein